MATMTFHLELVVSNITPERALAVRRALKAAGRTLHAKTLLICGEKPGPVIELYGDSMDGHVDINLQEDDDDGV